MPITLDGTLVDWTPSDRLETAQNAVAGYELYGRVEAGDFFFALRSAVPIGANTTFWLNTDGDTGTGHQIWGWAGGAEYNVNFGADGVPRLYTGADGQTLVGTLNYVRSADGFTLEMQIPKAMIGGSASALTILADVNNSVFLPSSFSAGGYVINEPVIVPPSEFDGLLDDWTAAQRLDTPETVVDGYELYGRVDAGDFVFALKSAVTIGTNTTFWLNTDANVATGHQIWGWAGGAEFNINFGADGVPRLYSGADGETLVGTLSYALGPDGKTLEIRIPRALVGEAVNSLTILADVNNAVFLPSNFGGSGYVIAEPVIAPPAEFDGLLNDWTAAQRLETPATAVDGYELYGKTVDGDFVFALKSAVAIGPTTTFWLNTDGDAATGHQIWGWAGGAEFNVNFGADGVPRLYSGADGETLIGTLSYALGPDGKTLEIRIPKALVGETVTALTVLADINNTIFLPSSFSAGGYVITPSVEVPPPRFDGLLNDWTQAERLEAPATTVDGYELYGRYADGEFIMALKSAVPIGSGTTLWLNTDGSIATGHQIWGWAGGADFNINIGADGIPRLYTGAAGEVLVGDLEFGIGPDGTTLEIAIPKALLGASVDKILLMADVNDTVFLPADYTFAGYALVDPASLPPVVTDGYKIAIVFSQSSADAYFSGMAYSQLIMAAQSQAMAAGIPFDVIGEADLTNLQKLAGYDAIVFPSFRTVPGNYAEIASVLSQVVFDYKVPLIAAGDFMTNDQAGAPLPGNPYERMQTLLGVTRTGGEDGVTAQIVGADGHAIVAGYGAEAIHTYTNAATAYFGTVGATVGTVIAQQIVNGTSHGAVISTATGGQNVHFATESLLADSNLLGKALDWVTSPAVGPTVSLHMSRNEAIVASRNDMDQSQEVADVDGGIYDALLPILTQWKADYNFVGSYYINIGLYGPDQQTDWAISSPYYNALLAMGNEIGSHSYSHPSDTNLLLPDTVTQEILDQRVAQYAALLNNPAACFCPYCTREDADQSVIDALASMSVGQINAVLQAALAAPNPATLDLVSRAILEASFSFQFGASRHAIEDGLGIVVTGAAVPGMPENLETARQIIGLYNYMTGGASIVGAGYPGAFGYLSDAETEHVYLAPNMSFDFTLIDWLGLNSQQALEKWIAEWNALTVNSDLPVVVWPWHDYGPTQWSLNEGAQSAYSIEMFKGFIEAAYTAGAEFVTLADLAERIVAFEKASFDFVVSGSAITVSALPQSGTLGTFAVNLGALGADTIKSVANWYAYDADSVFLDADGGTFQITLGTSADDVTHITSIGARAKLVALSGDGTDLDFTITGEGRVVIDLKTATGTFFEVTGASVVSIENGVMVLDLAGIGAHNVTLRQRPIPNAAPTDIIASNLAALSENTGLRTLVASLLVIDPDLDPQFRNNVLSVSDSRFEIDPLDSALYLKAGQTIDFETEPQITLTLTATDGALSVSRPLVLNITNVNEGPQGAVIIEGEAMENGILSANITTLTDPEGIAALSYQWQRDAGAGFLDIADATGATYTLTDADAGAAVRVRINYVDGGGATENVSSAPTAAVVDLAPAVVLDALSEDMTRILTPAQLAGALAAAGAFSILDLTASAGSLTALADGTWLYVPVLNDDGGVVFPYKVQTAQGTALATASLDLLGMTDVMGTTAANTLAGRTAADQYHGGAGNDTIRGGGGNDILFGDEGTDRVYGEAGNDVLVATQGDGNDTYDGGAGTDTYDLSRITAATTVNLNSGAASGTQIGTDSLTAIENVIGGSGNDAITGSSAANRLEGGAGNDTLSGGSGNDMLVGGTGDDRLDGGAGKDILTGGVGRDTFIFTATGHSGAGTSARDVITDFRHGEDIIDLSVIDAASNVSGNQAFTFLATPGTAFSGVRGQLQWFFEDAAGDANDRTIIAGDVNGDRVADFHIELSGLVTLTAVDFIL